MKLQSDVIADLENLEYLRSKFKCSGVVVRYRKRYWLNGVDGERSQE